MKKQIAFNLINKPRLTYKELLDQMNYFIGTNPELKNAIITDIWIEDDDSLINEGAIVMHVYDPVECLDGTLTIPVNKAINAN